MHHRARLGLLLPLVLLAPWAHAQDEPAPLKATWRAVGATVSVTFDVSVAFTEAFRKKLAGGLTSVAVIDLVLVDADANELSVRSRECRLRLDVWDDNIYVFLQDGPRVRRSTFQVIDDALKACGQVAELPLTELGALPAERGYRLLVRVSLNPVSAELLERTREFTANPRGNVSGRPRAFFGAVARLFRSDEAAAGTVFVFRSAPLERPKAGRP